MRKGYLFLILTMASIMMLSACSEKNVTTENNSQDQVVEKINNEVDDGTENQTDESENEEDESKETVENSSSPSGIEGIFQKAAEVMSRVEGMNLTGEIVSTTDMMGMVENETSQITGKVSMNPLVQYMSIDADSDLDGVTKNEMYVTEEAMYMSDPESGGWLSLPMELGGMVGDVSAIISESQLHYFEKVHHSFELAEDSDHYVMTFEGEGEDFKQMAFGAVQEIGGEEAYQNLVGMIEDISGKYVFTIDKSTFHIVAMEMDIEQTMDMGVGEVHSTEEIRYEYSGFNEVGEVVVPDDVSENAQTLDMTGGMGEN